MSFLLDTNICSAHFRRPAGLAHRFMQHSGRLFIPTIVLGELFAWAYRRDNPRPLLRFINSDLLQDVAVLDFDAPCAEEYGRRRGKLLRQGKPVGEPDVMIAAVALVHGLALVTHNTSDFQHIPGLTLEDWLVP
jgi:tRNA(fMet)-specific endonuclease VapC